jgi:hypothetical protein
LDELDSNMTTVEMGNGLSIKFVLGDYRQLHTFAEKLEGKYGR